MAKPKDETEGRVIENRKARFSYHILDTLEVGMVLRGTEVKSVREGKVSIAEGYVRVEDNPPSLTLYGMNIDAYGPAGPRNHNPKRSRPLLAHKREIAKFGLQVQQKGMTVVPLKLYFKNGYAKLLIGLAKGKNKSDKRQTIAKREAGREIDRAMSKRRG